MQTIIYDAIKKYACKKPVRFHMPGHKGRGKFLGLFKGASLDVTELDFIDNDGVRLRAEQDCAKILNADYLRFLTDGATSGILSMVYAVRDKGSKLVISRNSHKSVYNALKVCGIEPVVLSGKVENGVMLQPSVEQIESALNQKEVIGVLITTPDYYGNVADLKGISALCKNKGKLLLVDNSHGGHYAFFDDLDYAPLYADIAVDSAHKVFSTFNQGALITCNNSKLVEQVKEAVDVFSTTSPSYIILASIEYGIKSMASKKRINSFSQTVNRLKAKIKQVGFNVIENGDPFKLAVDFGGGGVGSDFAQKFLENKNIFAEMNDGRYLLFMFSCVTSGKEMDTLYRSIVQLKRLKDDGSFDKVTVNYIDNRYQLEHVKKTDYLYAVNSQKETIDLKDALNRVAGQNMGITPPCVPMVVAGEIISEQAIDALSHSANVFGIFDGKVAVVKSLTE